MGKGQELLPLIPWAALTAPSVCGSKIPMDAFPNFVYLYGAKVLGPGGMVKLRIPRFIFVDRHRCSGRTGVYVLEAKGTRHLDLDLDGTSL